MMASSIQVFFWLVFIMIAVLLQAAIAVQLNSAKKTASILSGTHIVEYSSALTRIGTNNPHELFYRKAASMTAGMTSRFNYSSRILIGTSFQLNNPDDISAIAALDSVAKHWPVYVYPPPDATVKSIINLADLDKAANTAAYNDSFPPHVMCGVDKLHEQGYIGTGVFIAIIDTGVDYNHPALGGGFGPGYKFEYGYDFVGDNYNGNNMPVPGPYPMDCQGHGTHVSGTVGANNAPTFTGVAPNATLGMYRVFGCTGGTGSDIIIAAYMRAHQDGAQIITASLGQPYGWTEEVEAVVVSRIAETGVSCTAATGNSGDAGLFYASTPANGIDVTAVGSVDSITIPITTYQGYFDVNSASNTTFQYLTTYDPFPANISGYPLYALDYNTSSSDDACQPLPSNTSTLSGKIVLIRRGTCGFFSQLLYLYYAGAQYVIFYNNEDPIATPDSLFGVSAVIVSADLGAQWISDLKAGQEITFYFPANPTLTFTNLPNNVTGGTMSTFSSWSPTFDLYIKPEVSAPGRYILSTYPLNLGGYAVLSGTSMATPYIAGVLGLYRSAKGSQININYQTLKEILATTATPVFFNDGTQTYPYLAPVAQQGGGLVNAFAAVHYTTLISPSTLSLNDTAHFTETTQFTISNTGSQSVSYILTHQAAATVYALGEGTTLPQAFPPELNTQSATVTISPSTLTIPADSSATVNLTFSPPTMLETQRIPVFSGYINVQSSTDESLHLPYMGIGCNMVDVTVTDFLVRPPYISNSSDDSSTPQPVDANEVFLVSTGLPNLNLRLVMGSPFIRLDILGDGDQIEVLGVNILGSVPSSSSSWIPRNDVNNYVSHYNATWNGTLSSGDQVPAGNYRFLYRALRIFGDPNNPSDYENWISPVFGIEYNTQLTTVTTETTSPIIIINRADIQSSYNIKLTVFLIVMSFLFIA